MFGKNRQNLLKTLVMELSFTKVAEWLQKSSSFLQVDSWFALAVFAVKLNLIYPASFPRFITPLLGM